MTEPKPTYPTQTTPTSLPPNVALEIFEDTCLKLARHFPVTFHNLEGDLIVVVKRVTVCKKCQHMRPKDHECSE